MSRDEEDLGLDAVFSEPPMPPSPKPTFETYCRNVTYGRGFGDWQELEIRLVGSHSLWGHYLWNAAKAIGSYLDNHTELYRNRHVLELGAGGALPSIVAVLNGASKVVITDYPDNPLIENIEWNVNMNIPPAYIERTSVQGYIWGRPINSLLSALPPYSTPKFDLIILSDLIFNHSQHDALLHTCKIALSDAPKNESAAPCVLVFYTHHRPHLAHKDMVFFSKAEEQGWICEKVVEEVFPPMFPSDPGEETVRSTVHGWKLSAISMAS